MVEHVGFYGCANRLVRVRATKVERASKGRFMRAFPRARHRVECPACGFTHRINVAWRHPNELDEGKGAELTLPGD